MQLPARYSRAGSIPGHSFKPPFFLWHLVDFTKGVNHPHPQLHFCTTETKPSATPERVHEQLSTITVFCLAP